MRVLLVSANTERVNMATLPVGLACVAAATRRAGHETSFLDLMREPDPLAALRARVAAFAPEVIGVSVRNIDDQAMASPRFLLAQVREVVEACRASSPAPAGAAPGGELPRPTIVLGGAGYSLFPDAALAYLGADLGVAGEGEVAFPALLQRLASGGDPAGLPGVHVAGRPGAHAERQLLVAAAPPDRPLRWAAPRQFAPDLDALPLPEEELWADLDPAPGLWVPIDGRRGCPNGCCYCATHLLQGRPIRARSPRRLAELIARIARSGPRRFYLVDNSFNLPEAHALELCRELAGLDPRVGWRCILYPHRVSEELVRAMAAAGCEEVSLGFESGCPRVLHELGKRFSPEDVRRTSTLLGAAGIRRVGFLLLGGPGETRESVEESLAFAASLGLEQLRITVGLRIYPGTPLQRRALEEGLLAADDDLLQPRFYLAPGLAPWIHTRVQPG